MLGNSGSLLRTRLLLAAAVPRHVWDPLHHNHRQVDSYSKAIVDRRMWPAKKFIVGMEPRVLGDWAQFSLRNLSYAYNAKLRACNTFPDMIPVYQEMKQRGVKVDTDTMNVMLGRGARFTQITAGDLFKLFEEMCALGARPDGAVVEIMHTLWDHSTGADSAWREVQRLALIAHYDALCQREIERLGKRGVEDLLAHEVARYRRNVALLGGRLSVLTWQQYIAVISTAETLFSELVTCLTAYVPASIPLAEFPRTELRIGQHLQVPHLHKHDALGRPTINPAEGSRDHDRQAYRALFAEDIEINAVLLAAAERIVDAPLEGRMLRMDEPALMLLLEKVVRTSGVLLTADLLAQMMDICKYATNYAATERAAMRLLQCAFHGCAEADSPQRENWSAFAERTIDGRVVGRYLAARNPWGQQHVHMTNGSFQPFKAAQADGDDALENAERGGGRPEFTAAAVDERWASAMALVEDTDVLNTEAALSARGMIDVEGIAETYTGLACYLRSMFLEERYQPNEEQLRAAGATNTDPDAHRSRRAGVASRSMTLEACAAIFEHLQSLKQMADAHAAEVLARTTATEDGAVPQVLEPSLEMMESFALVAKHMLDFLLSRRDQESEAGRELIGTLFGRIGEFRHKLLEECRTQHDQRFRILWLQEM